MMVVYYFLSRDVAVLRKGVVDEEYKRRLMGNVEAKRFGA
jgi:hypothetical protein